MNCFFKQTGALIKDEQNYVEPDSSVICDSSRLDARGCSGAPDRIIEHEKGTCQYGFNDIISVCIYDNLNVQFAQLLK